MTNAVDAIKVDVTVKLIGIIGCSASGKSTVAHQLVSRLDSPLHPISTDNFFSDEVCAQLGTYEDYRCINYDAVAQWMSVLVRAVPTVSVSVLEEGCALSSSSASGASSADANAAMRLPRDWEDRVHEAWWEEIVLHLPEVGKYRRAAPYATSAAKASTSVGTAAAAPAAQCGSTLAEATFTGAHPHDGLSDNDEDLSLCAHEAEEEDRRRISVSALTQRTDGGSGTVSLPLNSRNATKSRHRTPLLRSRITSSSTWCGKASHFCATAW
ncbi:hypothetical protein, conserved [Leishmania tarentolae]|uniref:Uncharacterized protein n=1 Tax=Leishmania tarentolae TaxID=5689 RepID=A0A640KIU6_LEITA|nr:hypothetical protein, conserved [Leishmania tarentolae]